MDDSDLSGYDGALSWREGDHQVYSQHAQSGEEAQVCFHRVGEDEADARALARHLKISRYIRFTGRIPYRRAVKWLSRSDIGLLPMEDTSLFRARHPLKMLDYMAAGVCCLASNVGEARHFIKNRFSGILVPPGDMSELSQKIVYLSHHPAIRERIAQEGQKAISVLEVGRHIHRWASLYRNS